MFDSKKKSEIKDRIREMAGIALLGFSDQKADSRSVVAMMKSQSQKSIESLRVSNTFEKQDST